MAAHKRKMYGNKKKHPSVLIRSAVFFRKAKKTASDMFVDRTNIHSNHIIETGVVRWMTAVGCFVSKIGAKKTDF